MNIFYKKISIYIYIFIYSSHTNHFYLSQKNWSIFCKFVPKNSRWRKLQVEGDGGEVGGGTLVFSAGGAFPTSQNTKYFKDHIRALCSSISS